MDLLVYENKPKKKAIAIVSLSSEGCCFLLLAICQLPVSLFEGLCTNQGEKEAWNFVAGLDWTTIVKVINESKPLVVANFYCKNTCVYLYPTVYAHQSRFDSPRN